MRDKRIHGTARGGKPNPLGLRGVTMAKSGKWIAVFTGNGTQKHLGTFATQDDAITTHDLYAIASSIDGKIFETNRSVEFYEPAEQLGLLDAS